MVEDLQLLKSRLEDIEKKYQELSSKQDKQEAKIEDKNDDTPKTSDEDKSREEKKDEDPEDEDTPLIVKLNRLSWTQWRKLRVSEDEWENKTDDQKKKEAKKRKVKSERFVIDVVADTGDLGLPAYTEKQGSAKRSRVPGRIRINSEHILDALNNLINIALPQKCQILHPYKIIIDNLDEIKEHMKTLEDELAKKELHDLSPVEGSNRTEKDSKTQSEDKSTKTKAEEDVELAQEKVAHYKCFIELLETDLAPEVEVVRSVRDGTAEKIMFCHLWHLFPPGETVYYQNSDRNEPPQAAQVLKVSGGRPRLPNSSRYYSWYWSLTDKDKAFQKVSPFTIDAFHLDFDGKKYRLVQDKYEIQRYTGEAPITSLTVFPLRFFAESARAETSQMLLTRGLNFRGLASVDAAHREYRGMTLDTEREDIDGRVIIDFKQAPVIDPSSSRKTSKDTKDEDDESKGRIFGLRPFTQTKQFEYEEVIGSNEDLDLTLYNDHTYDGDKSDKLFSVNKVLLAPLQEMNSDDLTDEELRLLPGSVYAYILRSRKYCKCDINLIKEISLNRQAFDDLVLPKHYKTLIKSLVDRHSLGSRPVEQKAQENKKDPVMKRTDSQSTKHESGQDTLSIVKGKGRGLIILLHGVPGVGKTSTAETVAEATGRPLLPVTCGDIGESAADVEKNLEQIFTNSHRWGCVLLLDEAEVFLTKRNLQDLTRNAMVSVFLRALEFYSGILFLTTNRVGTIDEAFKSRIHISLYYAPLDWKTSKLIWQVNIRRSQSKVDTDRDEIIRFAKKHFFRSDENSRWNGRQIYNAFKTAIALAEFEKQTTEDNINSSSSSSKKKTLPPKPVLTASHLRQVALVAKKFDEYLLETQGGETTAAMNQQHKVRADAFGLDGAPAQQKLKRRPTKNRMLDLDELPSTSEEDSDGSDDVSASSDGEEEEETEYEERKKSKRKGESSSKKGEDKKKSRKSKKSSKKPVDDDSDASS
ncbi:P-loop containing nucleoside triphosphate hydrolase protein [Hypoxylon rubiginosum]|uniref:P-loop containing nucleoside triphosphate hydrolase protein n=1 Tax=Hypoxylon rubiginosum TaxID=110542 RepID=A0ACB9YIB5_9PEZI|nr:P-loop containing nucleoside triphosphate hydrolase protein [Hypoxylon rubiginosum]